MHNTTLMTADDQLANIYHHHMPIRLTAICICRLRGVRVPVWLGAAAALHTRVVWPRPTRLPAYPAWPAATHKRSQARLIHTRWRNHRGHKLQLLVALTNKQKQF